MGFIYFIIALLIPSFALADVAVIMDVVLIQDKITENDANAVTALNPDKIAQVELDSTGGDYYASKKIAAWVRQHKIDTYLDDASGCWSGCTLIFQAGVNRYSGADTKLGYHSVRTRFKKTDDIALNPALTNELIGLYRLYGMAEKCIARIPASNVYDWHFGLAYEFAGCNIVTKYTTVSKRAGTRNSLIRLGAVTRMTPGTLSHKVH